MEGTGKLVAGLVIGLVVGGAAGFLGGGATGAKLGADQVIQGWVRSEAERAGETVGLLEQVRAKEAGALEGLEAHLDRHVFGLMPSTLATLQLDAPTRAKVDEAVARARAYRAANPRAATTALGKDVEAFLSTSPPR